jgi:hypothetical protein
MPSNAFPENPVDPVSAVDELLNWLLSTSVHCAVAIVLGLLAARAMHSRHLHWSWAVVALALVTVARPLLGSSGSPLAPRRHRSRRGSRGDSGWPKPPA